MKLDEDARTRSLTGIVFLTVMVAGILISDLSVTLLFGLIVSVACIEFARMTQSAHPWLYGLIGLGLFGGLTSISNPTYSMTLYGLVAIGILIPISARHYFQGLAFRMMGLLLIPLAFSFLLKPEIALSGRKGILMFFILLWVYDSLAYVWGRLLGKHKLWARISPGKTWEGFIGGLISTCIVAYFLYQYTLEVSRAEAIGLGAIIAIFGTMGDLLESSLKRRAGVKDSGSFMPGHGGMLDRFDGVMLASPAFFFFIWYMNH